MKIGDLFVTLGIKADQRTLKDFISGMGDLNLSSVMAGLGVGAVGTALGNLLLKASEFGQMMKNFTAETGQSAVELQKWSNFAEQLGVEADTVMGSMKGLQAAITAIKLGGGNIAPFQMLGIDPRGKTMVEILKELGPILAQLDPAIARHALSMMGIDEAMIPVLKAYAANAEAVENQIHLNEQEIETLARLKQALTELKQIAGVGSFKAASALTNFFTQRKDEGFLENLGRLTAGPVLNAAFEAAPSSKTMSEAGRKVFNSIGSVAITIQGSGATPVDLGRRIVDELMKVFSEAEYQSGTETT